MVGFWVIMVILGVCIVGGCGAWLYYGVNESSVGHSIASVVVGLILLAGLIIGGIVWYNSEPGQRAQKSWQSETQGGLTRVVTIYDINGKIIKQYEGKFDVDYDESRIIFDDENGKRHVIYYTTGTVCIDEQ